MSDKLELWNKSVLSNLSWFLLTEFAGVDLVICSQEDIGWDCLVGGDSKGVAVWIGLELSLLAAVFLSVEVDRLIVKNFFTRFKVETSAYFFPWT